MKSLTTPDFRATYSSLPHEIKARVRVAYRLWKHNPRHPSLQFKKVGNMWSIRIGGGYRALALFDRDTFYWFWIGMHDEYERRGFIGLVGILFRRQERFTFCRPSQGSGLLETQKINPEQALGGDSLKLAPQ